MEEKKQIKVSLGTVFLVIAIILIVVMGALLYMQKTESDRKIAELENNASKLQETISDLQGKIDTISNTINSNEEEDNTTNKTKEEEENQNKIKEIYSVEFSSEDEFIQIFEYDNSNDSYAEIHYKVLAGYSGDPSVRYVLKITDESNNSLLLSSDEEFVDGTEQSVKIKKIDLNQKINFEVWEKFTNINNVVTMTEYNKKQIDLQHDLKIK